MSLALRYAVRSDAGLVRDNNEDSVYAGPRLLAIADGMGGHAAGEVASKIVIGSLESLDEDRPLGDIISALRESVEEANESIADAVHNNADLDGMGTTLTALRFSGGQVGLVHVGDSRAYLLRNQVLTQITHDDTYVQSLVDSGRLTLEEASHHPRKSVILRALMGLDVEPDVSIREARPGDRYLLCTDGLSDVVTAVTLAETLADGTPQEAADALVDLALRGGGPDNITCIVADVVDAAFSGDDIPVIAGAFIDSPGAVRTGDSPAERAARRRAPEVPEPVPSTANRTQLRMARRLVAPVLTLAIVLAGLFGFYAWTQRQYYVGQDGSEVAIFQGVNSSFGPVKFFNVAQNTDIKMSDLNQAARNQVEAGITAHSLKEAEQIKANLLEQRIPVCPTTTPRPSPTATVAPLPGETPALTPAQSSAPATQTTPVPTTSGGTPTCR